MRVPHSVTGLVKILTLKSLNRVSKGFYWPSESNFAKFEFLVSKYVFYVYFYVKLKKSLTSWSPEWLSRERLIAATPDKLYSILNGKLNKIIYSWWGFHIQWRDLWKFWVWSLWIYFWRVSTSLTSLILRNSSFLCQNTSFMSISMLNWRSPKNNLTSLQIE